MTAATYTQRTVELAGKNVFLLQGGSGEAVWILHHSVGNPGWLDFYERLAQRFEVTVPDLPGYGQSDRPEWARDTRDMAILVNQLLDKMGVESVSLIGLGFGGYIAAEVAAMDQRRIRRLVLVGAAGIQPREGEILDQIITEHAAYVRTGFHDEAAFERQFTDEGEVPKVFMDLWDFSREMTARINWRPYMFDRRLPFLLRGVEMPTLVVWGDDDRIIPLDSGKQFAEALPNGRLEVIKDGGHFLEIERSDELAALVEAHLAGE